jgi:hypothetical protein
VSHGIKEGKDRFTALLATSAVGEKLKPMIVGRSENPRTFPKQTQQLSFYYASSASAWMTSVIFLRYLLIMNVIFKAQNRCVAVILDNCSCHKIDETVLSNIELFFLPPNTTAIGQPLDAGLLHLFSFVLTPTGIIECSKREYRARFIKMKLDFVYKSIGKNIQFKIDFFTAVCMYVNSFYSIPNNTIVNCWKKCKICRNETPISTAEVQVKKEKCEISSETPISTLKVQVKKEEYSNQILQGGEIE